MNFRDFAGCFALLLFLPIHASARPQGPFLDEFTTSLPMNGDEIETSLPLRPYQEYTVEIISPHTLTELLETKLVIVNGIWKQWSPKDELSREIHTGTGIIVNGNARPPFKVPDDENKYVGRIPFSFLGVGEPLRIRTAGDYSDTIRWAELMVKPSRSARVYWWVPDVYREQIEKLKAQSNGKSEAFSSFIALPIAGLSSLCFLFFAFRYKRYARQRRQEEQLRERSDYDAEEKDFFTEEEYQQAKLASQRPPGRSAIERARGNRV